MSEAIEWDDGTVLPGAFGMPEEPGWQERALCAQTDPEAFFPEKGGSTREAKRICTTCEVRSECLEYALEKDERFGIWGGLSERERRRLKRRAV
jgi:WhiB family redox-sensing transcriptional regulator